MEEPCSPMPFSLNLVNGETMFKKVEMVSPEMVKPSSPLPESLIVVNGETMAKKVEIVSPEMVKPSSPLPESVVLVNGETMAKKVEIVSPEMVKPSSPLPESLILVNGETMAEKVEIVSPEMVKPSSPLPESVVLVNGETMAEKVEVVSPEMVKSSSPLPESLILVNAETMAKKVEIVSPEMVKLSTPAPLIVLNGEAMAKKVDIVSSEMVKPSSPTPENLRIYKLSLKDQMGSSASYSSMIVFYATATVDFSSHLKESLRLALNHDCMYPLAGRIKDTYSIDCNDQGALFVQTRVNEEFSNVIKNPKNSLYLQLFPQPPQEVWTNPCERVLLAVQVNEFVNGGIAISMSASHGITDGAALAFFLKNWASIALARSEGKNHNLGDGFVVDCTAIFPPRDVMYVVKNPPKKEDLIGENTKGNIFTFSASNIVSIKEKCSKGGLARVTRFEAMSAFLWASVMSVRKKSGRSLRMHVNCNSLNLRTRIVPPLPLHCLGNLAHVAPAVCGATEEVGDLGVLVEKIRNALRRENQDTVTNEQSLEDGFKTFLAQSERSQIATDGIGLLVTSSLCRFPFYEVDFGWGKPSWVGFDRVRNNFSMLMDAADGEGIEVWMRLEEEDMVKLEQDVDFISYVSSIDSL